MHSLAPVRSNLPCKIFVYLPFPPFSRSTSSYFAPSSPWRGPVIFPSLFLARGRRRQVHSSRNFCSFQYPLPYLLLPLPPSLTLSLFLFHYLFACLFRSPSFSLRALIAITTWNLILSWAAKQQADSNRKASTPREKSHPEILRNLLILSLARLQMRPAHFNGTRVHRLNAR